MPKKHHHIKYEFESDKIFDFVTLCGIRKSKHKNIIHSTILSFCFNCKTCKKIFDNLKHKNNETRKPH